MSLLLMEEQHNKKLFAEFFDWQPQSFVWLQPVWDEDHKNIIDFQYTYSNETGLEYLKLTREMLGKIKISDTPSLTDEMRPRIFKEMYNVYTTGETVTIDMYNPVIDRYGTVSRMKFRDGVLTTIQDKTVEKRAIIELDKRTKELQQVNDSLKEFAYIASHDLQEPLRKIRTFLSRLERELAGLNDAQQNIFNRIDSSTTRMQELIDDLLAYSLVSIRQNISESIDLHLIVQDVVQDLENSIREGNVEVTIDDLPEVKGDESQLRQLFQNLISNAVKYRSKEKTPMIKVQSKLVSYHDQALAHFSGLEKRSYHLVEVIDNGIGFEKEHAENIFQVFFRLHGRTAYAGTGIGLAIVQRVVQNHHGFIKAISTPGEGSTFQVLLPA